MNLAISLIALSFVVFFHELGHFVFAKFFGVRVQIFSIGFGPKLFSYHYKDTQYSISLFPLGGYVKLQGESNNTNDLEPNSLFAKHPLKRIAILFAGSLFNVLLAFLLYVCIFLHGLPTYSNKPIIGEIDPKFPSSSILHKNDVILSINEIAIQTFQDISKILNQADSTHHNAKLSDTNQIAKLVVSRKTNLKDNESNTDTKLSLEVPLVKNDNKLLLGITPKQELRHSSLQDSIMQSFSQTIHTSALLYKGLRDLLIGVIGLENVSSIIGITNISLKALNVDFIFFLWVVAFISINLGIINLLPLPLLDGGQILFTCYEWITGKSISQKVANMLVSISISIIGAIMCIGIYNDISALLADSI